MLWLLYSRPWSRNLVWKFAVELAYRPGMQAQDTTTPHALVQRISALAARLVERNRVLEAEVADLQDHIEGLTTKLTAAQAANHTFTQGSEPTPAVDSIALASAHRDTTERLERLRAELDDYLSEVDRRLHVPPSNADAP